MHLLRSGTAARMRACCQRQTRQPRACAARASCCHDALTPGRDRFPDRVVVARTRRQRAPLRSCKCAPRCSSCATSVVGPGGTIATNLRSMATVRSRASGGTPLSAAQAPSISACRPVGGALCSEGYQNCPLLLASGGRPGGPHPLRPGAARGHVSQLVLKSKLPSKSCWLADWLAGSPVSIPALGHGQRITLCWRKTNTLCWRPSVAACEQSRTRALCSLPARAHPAG